MCRVSFSLTTEGDPGTCNNMNGPWSNYSCNRSDTERQAPYDQFYMWYVKKNLILEFLLWLSGLHTQIVSMRMQIQYLALLSGLRIWHCRELWCSSQTQLWSGVNVTVRRLAATPPIWPLAWEPPYAMGVAFKKTKDKRQKKKKKPC